MVPGQRHKQRWLRSLAELEPDLVVNTGDNLSHPDAIGEVLDALAPLLDRPGVFVFGSNDYFMAKPINPTRYLRRDDPSHRPRRKGPENDWQVLREGFTGAGWLDLTNRRDQLKVGDHLLSFVGLDDPHVKRDRYDHVPGGVDRDAELTLGIVHAPYRRALDALVAEHLPLLLAGHTHGGQLCLPFYGTLVTNCDLDRKRARGLSTYTPADSPAPAGPDSLAGTHGPAGTHGLAGAHSLAGSTAYLHVSAGCGASRYAPVRFACPPEASLLTLLPHI
jgi:predicted MPP superfamily phosphohydrolase